MPTASGRQAISSSDTASSLLAVTASRGLLPRHVNDGPAKPSSGLKQEATAPASPLTHKLCRSWRMASGTAPLTDRKVMAHYGGRRAARVPSMGNARRLGYPVTFR